MKSIATLSIAFCLLAFTSCRKYRLVGEGAIVSETRTLSSFTSVNADGDVDVDVYPSNENKVIVTAYQNLIPVYETDVNGSTLSLHFKTGYINVRHNNVRVAVYSTDVNNVVVNGSGKVIVKNGIASKTLNARINGSGDVTINDNHFESMTLKINGSGSIKSRSAVSDYVRAEISGSGDIETTVEQTLSAKISGSGNIDYWGNPSVSEVDLSGSGKVRKH